MLTAIIPIARNTFIESVRQPIFFVMIALCGLLQLLNTWISAFSMGYTTTAEVSGDNKLLLDIGLATIFVAGMLLAAFVATAVVSREIENKTVLTVVSKPIGRPALVIGKYLGVTGAILIATFTMLLFLLMGIRHGVMTTAADTLDGPVIVFTTAAVLGSVLIACWTNFFYGWSFAQTSTLLMLPLMIVAYALVLNLSKDWTVQPVLTDVKPQIIVACAALVLSTLVLTAMATAVSTRLGQVMTIAVCGGIFILGLLSNHFIGRHAFENTPASVVGDAAPTREGDDHLDQPGDTYVVTLSETPSGDLGPGASFYYSPSPDGRPMLVDTFPAWDGPTDDPDALDDVAGPGRLLVLERNVRELVVKHVGRPGLEVGRPPETGDFVFVQPTRINPVALSVWGAIPNMHFFWLVDAVTQNMPVPPQHLGLIALYAAFQIGGFLAVGVMLFQTRDVG